MIMMWAMLLGQAAEEGSPSGFDPFLKSAVWLGLIAVVVWIMLRSTHKRIAKNEARKNLTVKQRVAEARQGSVIVDRVTELMSELADMSRQVNGELDTRTAKLEILLDEADRKIAMLQSGLGEGDSYVPSAESSASADSSVDLADNSRADDWPVNSSEVDSPSADSTAEDVAADLDSPEHQQIRDLAGEGFSAQEIARKVDRPVGEVELILALGRKKR